MFKYKMKLKGYTPKRRIKYYWCPDCDKRITQMQTIPPAIGFATMSVTPIMRDVRRCRKCGAEVDRWEPVSASVTNYIEE